MQRLLITAGEPAGIGPDICLQLATTTWADELVVIADADLLRSRAQRLSMDLDVIEFDPTAKPGPITAGQLKVWHIPLRTGCTPGHLDVANSPYVIDILNLACDTCLQGKASAMITAPVHKGIINDAGIGFSGHTEYLQARCHSDRVVMMLATTSLKVALATTHLPLSKVAQAITPNRLKQVLEILHQQLQQCFRIDRPHILVCGLNPHAGEGGYLGHEEEEIIIPTLNQLREKGMHLTGPLPADTLFTNQYLQSADAVLAMYHDQGLPVLKFSGFGAAVNITLGLPIVRTSVDHGTALDLAGSGQARADSLLQAVSMAQDHSRP
jgi:4-hydroxythreonine-4-phosphate dehydrogenase